MLCVNNIIRTRWFKLIQKNPCRPTICWHRRLRKPAARPFMRTRKGPKSIILTFRDPSPISSVERPSFNSTLKSPSYSFHPSLTAWSWLFFSFHSISLSPTSSKYSYVYLGFLLVSAFASCLRFRWYYRPYLPYPCPWLHTFNRTQKPFGK